MGCLGQSNKQVYIMILHILGFASLAHLLGDLFQHMEINTKPFNCNLCLGFWVSLVPMIILYQNEGFLLSAITGVISEGIYRILTK